MYVIDDQTSMQEVPTGTCNLAQLFLKKISHFLVIHCAFRLDTIRK
jgi:hypothetical protein